MANTRQLVQIDEEALVPKRVKKKKIAKNIAKDIAVIVKEIENASIYLNAFKQTLIAKELFGILGTHFTNTGLPLLDIHSLFNYSSTSKQAYINTHEHPICRFSLFSDGAQKTINKAKKQIINAQHNANLATETTTLGNNGGWLLTLAIGVLTIGGALLAMILIMHQLRKGDSSDSSESNEKSLSSFLTFSTVAGCIGTGLFFYWLITHKVYGLIANYCNNTKKDYEENAEQLNELTEALKNNDLSMFQKKLDQYYNDEESLKMEMETETQPANERTQLLRN